MFKKFDEEAKKVLVNMKKEMVNLRHPYIGSEHLFLSLLKYGNKSDIEKLEKHGLTYKGFKTELINIVGLGNHSNDFFLYTPLLRNVLETAWISASEKGKDEVGCSDLLLAILDEGEGIAIRIIMGMNIRLDALYEDFYTITNKKAKKSKSFIENFGVNLNDKCLNGEIDPVIGRDKEVQRLIEILSRRTKNNPLLIGEAGVGKTAIVEELSRLIVDNKVNSLRNKKIISVSMASLVAGTKYRGEFEERVGKVIKEMEKNSDIILFIDEIHTLVGAGGAEGAIDASNILKPALARGKIKVIGATTTEEYKKHIESDKALERRFQTIEIKEPSLEVVKCILKKLTPIYEGYHKVRLSDEIINNMVELSDKYLYERKMPDKAIDILDEVCSKVAITVDKKNKLVENLNEELTSVKKEKNDAIINNNFAKAFTFKQKENDIENKINKLEIKMVNEDRLKRVTLKDVKEVIEAKSKIPVFTSEKEEGLKDFKKKLCACVLGQEDAIDKLYSITKKIRFGYKKNLVPYSFLFVGSSGVGKTLLVKEYSNLYYGKDNLIRLDMSEYKEDHTISKIIGSPPGYVGYSDNKTVFEEVKNKPYSIILLDEIEKASKNVINLFLQILDEGKAKNSKGETIRFDNTIIIMTSNLGSSNKSIGFNSKRNNNELYEFFGTSFINRIGNIIYFNDIDDETIEKIVNKKIVLLKKHYKEKGIKFSLSKNIIQEIIKLCEYEKYGARKVDKVIEDYLESIIVDSIIGGISEIRISTLKLEAV